jgi:hypothetical protein
MTIRTPNGALGYLCAKTGERCALSHEHADLANFRSADVIEFHDERI